MKLSAPWWSSIGSPFVLHLEDRIHHPEIVVREVPHMARRVPRALLEAVVRERIEHHGIRAAAVKALGTQRNPKALALLQPLVAVAKPYSDPVRSAAEKSIQALEAEQAKPQEFKDVWTKMQELQKKTEELERQLEKLWEKFSPEKPSSQPEKPAGK